MAHKTAEPIETRRVTLTIQQWKWLAETWRVNSHQRSRSDLIVPDMAVALTRMAQYVDAKSVGKKDTDTLDLEASLYGLSLIVEYLTHIPNSFSVGKSLAIQVAKDAKRNGGDKDQ